MNATPARYKAFVLTKQIMINVLAIHFDNGTYYGYDPTTQNLSDGFWTNEREADLLMYTGIVDKKDQEIFESDIVDMDGAVRVVIWCPKSASFVFSRCKGERLNRELQDHYEKLGNKYLNPELVRKYKL